MVEETERTAGKLQLRLVTYKREVLDVECDQVALPGKEGYFGVLPGHTPFITTLKVGELVYRIGKIERYLAISWGFCEVFEDRVTVLAEFAEHPEEIDIEAAQLEAEEAEKELLVATAEGFARAQARLEKAVVRVEVARRAR